MQVAQTYDKFEQCLECLGTGKIEKLKSPAKIILQINTENEINNKSREISRDY